MCLLGDRTPQGCRRDWSGWRRARLEDSIDYASPLSPGTAIQVLGAPASTDSARPYDEGRTRVLHGAAHGTAQAGGGRASGIIAGVGVAREDVSDFGQCTTVVNAPGG